MIGLHLPLISKGARGVGRRTFKKTGLPFNSAPNRFFSSIFALAFPDRTATVDRCCSTPTLSLVRHHRDELLGDNQTGGDRVGFFRSAWPRTTVAISWACFTVTPVVCGHAQKGFSEAADRASGGDAIQGRSADRRLGMSGLYDTTGTSRDHTYAH